MARTARLGAFIIVTLAILAAGVFIIGSKQYLFTPTYRLKAQFATVVGLDSGAEVRIGGVHTGTVREIDELILKLQEEHDMASIVVTHDLQSAKTIADRIALLHEGNVLIDGSFEDLEKSDNEFVTEFMKRDS